MGIGAGKAVKFMVNVVRRSGNRTVDVEMLLTEFRGHRSMLTEIGERVDLVKATLMAILERKGEPDEKGSLWINFDQPVAGYKAIKRERRSRLLLDVDKATKILRAAGRWEQCVDVDITIDAEQMERVLGILRQAGVYDQVVTVTERLNDDKIMQLYYAESDEPGALTETDIDAMFHEEITWAFVPQQEGR